jgi:hypothetical protein
VQTRQTITLNERLEQQTFEEAVRWYPPLMETTYNLEARNTMRAAIDGQPLDRDALLNLLCYAKSAVITLEQLCEPTGDQPGPALRRQLDQWRTYVLPDYRRLIDFVSADLMPVFDLDPSRLETSR